LVEVKVKSVSFMSFHFNIVIFMDAGQPYWTNTHWLDTFVMLLRLSISETPFTMLSRNKYGTYNWNKEKCHTVTVDPIHFLYVYIYYKIQQEIIYEKITMQW